LGNAVRRAADLDRLGIAGCQDVAELGCGYGTFTVPIAKRITGTLSTFDVDSAMIDRTRARAAGLPVRVEHRDVTASGFGLTADCVLLFNILHCDGPVELLRHAASALNPGGRALVIHWRYGETPRGPDLSIRPKPGELIEWAGQAGLDSIGDVIDLPPWHYGLQFEAARAKVQPTG
jgi:SAM-dependent methyltransferase